MDIKSKDHIAKDLLSRAHPPTFAQHFFNERVKLRPLHFNPSTSTPPTDAQQARRQARSQKRKLKKLKPRPLSSRQKRALQLYDIPPSEQKYSIYEPLNRMWNGYILEVLSGEDGRLSLPVTGNSVAKVCGADFHGAEVLVVRSGCPSRVGVGGIVVKDSRGVFEVVTKASKIKILPKEGTIFQVKVRLPEEAIKGQGQQGVESSEGIKQAAEEPEPKANEQTKELIFEVHGDQFICRAADRATKKFRWHFLPNV